MAELSDAEAIVAMDIENQQRKDISPYERGVSYASWLRGGYFSSQDDIARALNISSSQVSRLLKLARLPSVVINAFETALHIREGWGAELAELLSDPVKRQSAIQTARAISSTSPRPPARDIYRKILTSASRGRKPADRGRDKVVKARDGSPLFRVKHQQNAIALLLPLTKISARCLHDIEEAVSHIMEEASTLSSEAAGKERESRVQTL